MNAREILKTHQFRVTLHRINVLGYFIQSTRICTQQEVEAAFNGEIHRVSIYRILKSFTDAQILCKIIDSNGKISYLLNDYQGNEHGSSQPHFKCKNCNEVTELPELPKSYIDQLTQMNIDKINILAVGTCKHCEEEKRQTKWN